jgi:tetratricopeptide (TPR) repeat protein
LEAFDAERMADAARLFEPLCAHDDPFLTANASYLHVRALVALSHYETAEAALAAIDARQQDYVAHTPYAPHLWFLKGFCEARNLRFDAAMQSLEALGRQFPEAPEAVRVGATQLRLEIERRERGTLGEVATVMDYVADRLKAVDSGERVRTRQRQIIALLDRLIREQEAQEQQCGGGSAGGRRQPSQPRAASTPRRESDAPGGTGQVGDLHAAPEANPGEMWGKLPPTEREKILQSIREKFPSRYRQLVEQYYRALAEEQRATE